MSIPYTTAFAARLLRIMPAERLALITHAAFQMWPAEKPLPAAIGRELIAAERARRGVR